MNLFSSDKLMMGRQFPSPGFGTMKTQLRKAEKRVLRRIDKLDGTLGYLLMDLAIQGLCPL